VLDRKVALKLLQRGMASDTAGRQRLLREAQSMARLAHPNVVTVLEVGGPRRAAETRRWLAARRRRGR